MNAFEAGEHRAVSARCSQELAMPTAFVAPKIRQNWSTYRQRWRLTPILLALLCFAVGCSRPYVCEERGQGASAECSCVQASRSSPAGCQRKYDCCAGFTKGSILADDPNSGYGCFCWMLEPGEICESSSQFLKQGSWSNLDSRPKTCPP
jgi:hypothetical protein